MTANIWIDCALVFTLIIVLGLLLLFIVAVLSAVDRKIMDKERKKRLEDFDE